MSCLFKGCISLISIPDISKWNTNNITDFNNIFSGCVSLISLPDIFKWNTNKVKDMDKLPLEQMNLSEYPHISRVKF